jgi:hypothetical protein
MSFRSTKQILKEGSTKALESLTKITSCHRLSLKELLYVFDCLFTDYLTEIRLIDVEMWRAKSFMYGLQDDEEEGKKILQRICCELERHYRQWAPIFQTMQ